MCSWVTRLHGYTSKLGTTLPSQPAWSQRRQRPMCPGLHQPMRPRHRSRSPLACTGRPSGPERGEASSRGCRGEAAVMFWGLPSVADRAACGHPGRPRLA